MRLSKSEREKQRAGNANILRDRLPAGSTVYLSLSHVSRSGMSRTIKCVTKDMENISGYVAFALGYPFVEGLNGGVRVSGCGMDMGLALVSALSYELYGKPCDQTTSYREGQRKPNGGIGYRWI